MVDKITTLTTVHVNSADLYKTGHMAHRWFGTLSRRLSTFTKARAPKRSGRLRSGIHTKMSSVPSTRTIAIDWRSEVLYTTFVLRGTTGPIMTDKTFAVTGGTGEFPNHGIGTLWLYVPGKWEGTLIPEAQPGYWMHFGGYGWPYVFRTAVNGQRANNFLMRGWNDTAHFHRAMRPTPSFIRNP